MVAPPHWVIDEVRTPACGASAGSEVALVAARDLSKMHRLYDRPRDRLAHGLLRRFGRSYGREFWALRDVSFEVRRGEAVAIVGRNGSGKSTLLEIVAGVLRPTTGGVVVRGRVGALLELGSGFNPEFTGRENVLLSGAILGIPRREMMARIGAVAAFADIGAFFDQPVKVYSSGMFVRLAFAVHTVLPTDVLVVDEALAVGDEAFQRKCFAYLEAYRARGGAVLFVSHSMQAVVRVASRALLLEGGRRVMAGDPKQVADAYHLLLYGTAEQRMGLLSGAGDVAALATGDGGGTDRATAADGAHRWVAAPRSLPEAHHDPALPRLSETAYGNGDAEIAGVAMTDDAGRPANVLIAGQRCRWTYRVRFLRDADAVSFGMMIKTVDGVDVVGVNSRTEGQVIARIAAGSVVDVRFRLTLNLVPGYYVCNAGVEGAVDGSAAYLHRRVDVAAFRVLGGDERRHHGIAFVAPELGWSMIAPAEQGGAPSDAA